MVIADPRDASASKNRLFPIRKYFLGQSVFTTAQHRRRVFTNFSKLLPIDCCTGFCSMLMLVIGFLNEY